MLASARKGIILGGVTALLFCGWITLIYFTGGSKPFADKGLSYGGTVATYLCMGIGCGAIVGWLLPLVRSTFVAYVVGVVGAVPIAMSIAIQQGGPPWRWDSGTQTLVPVLILVGGIVIGNEVNKRRGHADSQRTD